MSREVITSEGCINLLTGITSRHDYTYIQLAKGGNHCAEFGVAYERHVNFILGNTQNNGDQSRVVFIEGHTFIFKQGLPYIESMHRVWRKRCSD